MGLRKVACQSSKVAGRLQFHISNWKLLTKDSWVLNTIQGYQLALLGRPTQWKTPHPSQFNQEQWVLIQEEMDNLLEKGAISEVYNPQDGYFSNLFLVPKKDRGQRPVINLKGLNQFVQYEHFKMEGIQTVKDLLQPGDWLTKIDLKDAYFTIPMNHSNRKYLRFTVRGRSFEFNCLPFGLSSAPWVFTKTLKPVTALLREPGIRLVIYIDDILIMAESTFIAERHTVALVYLLECLGFVVNTKQSVFQPQQSLEFLGFVINSVYMEMLLPRDKLKKIRLEAQRLLREDVVSARSLSRLIGKMNATNQVIPPAPLFYRNLQMSLHQALRISHSQNYEQTTVLSPGARTELDWWVENMSKWNGKALLKRQVDLTIDSDASLSGWGATCGNQRTGGPWSSEERHMHINCLELLAATLAVQTFTKNLEKVSVLMRIDNTTAVAYVNHKGGTASQALVDLTKNLWMWCLERNIVLIAQHLPGVLNQIADSESRKTWDQTDWKLEVSVFGKINQLYGPIQVDLFATRLTNQVPTFFSWRPDPYAVGTDAFLQDWSMIRNGYANPPVCLIGRILSHVKAQKNPGNLGGTGLEIAALVPGCPGNVGRLSEDNTGEPPCQGISSSTVTTPISRMEYLRKRYASEKLSEEASGLLLKSWRSKTNKSYDSLFRKWSGWCMERGSDPFSGPIVSVVNFLADLHKQGYKYQSLNAYRSAISSTHERIEGFSVGEHPMVSKLMKGVYHDRPPLPKYTVTWNVQTVLTYLESAGENSKLSLTQLTYKTVMLLALTRPTRSADLSQMNIQGCHFSPEGVKIFPSALAKQSRQGKSIKPFFFPIFPENTLICPVTTLKAYMTHTLPLRAGETKLFIATIKPHKDL